MKTINSVLLFILIAFFATVSSADDITLTWTHPYPANVTGYKIYTGVTSGQYGNPTDVGNVMAHIFTFNPATPVTFFFVATAYNSNGESEYSNEVNCTAGLGVLSPPTLSIE